MGDDGRPIEWGRVIQRAQRGDRECLSQLSGWARHQVLPYLFRVGLDYHLAQDLCQETMIRLLEYLPRLTLADEHALRAWLYRTAYSRLQQYGRQRTRLKAGGSTVHHSDLTETAAAARDQTFEQVAHTELSHAVQRAMQPLKLSHRRILTLRCFEQLSYAQIASITGGSQLQAKLCFFRAKQSLKKQLLRQGITRGCLLPALGAFAAVTTGSSDKAAAATTVATGSLKVGVCAALIGGLTTKLGVAVTAMAVTGLVAAHSAAPLILPARTVDQVNPGLSTSILRQVHARMQNQASHFDLINVGIVYDANVILYAGYGPQRNLDAIMPLLGVNPVTSTICLCLLNDGVIRSLDDPIAAYSDRFVDCQPRHFARPPITFRHLLGHTGGLPGHHAYATKPVWRAGRLNLQTRPGSERTPSAAGYAVLETLMEDITGRSYDELVNQYIAAPLAATSFQTIEPADANVAGVLCNVRDFTGFMAALLQGRLLPGEQLRQVAWTEPGLGWYTLQIQDSVFPDRLYNHFAWGRYDVYAIVQPCGQMAAAIFMQWPSDERGYFNEFQFCFDLLGLIGEQHMQERGFHQPTWEIP